ncbi:hypothetical protein [Streptomyces sp. NPDC050564]|uniref:hypothetical protein n=1 Tax=Streptomyces sp. NPDC050564 TaxID=3365631 RepID=UPI003793B615
MGTAPGKPRQPTGTGACSTVRQWSTDVDTLWIYSPVEDPEQILAQAGRFSNL